MRVVVQVRLRTRGFGSTFNVIRNTTLIIVDRSNGFQNSKEIHIVLLTKLPTR